MSRTSQIIWTDWQSLSDYLKEKKPSSLFVLVDQHTSKHCWPICAKKNTAFQDAEILEIPAGETSKEIGIINQLWQAMLELKADRDSLLINLGGGVVSDIGGFLASTYMRGIDFINIPTSLLGMVDASIGGKNGINLEQGKNLVGTIQLPEAVLIDTDFLDTLPDSEFRSGFAEMIKHALIAGKNEWSSIKSCNIQKREDVKKLVLSSSEIKKKVVDSDFKESGARKKLNLGHSFGHAVEAIARIKEKELRHGEAIAIGLVAESDLSRRLGLIDDVFQAEIERFILEQYQGLEAPPCRFEELLVFLEIDKKNRGELIRFSLLQAVGKLTIDQSADRQTLKKVWNYTLKSFNG